MESYIAVAKHSGRASWRLALLLLVIALFLIPTHMLAEEPHHRIQNIIVIYQENWSFDSLYGLFPGANECSGLRPCRSHSATVSPVSRTAHNWAKRSTWYLVPSR